MRNSFKPEKTEAAPPMEKQVCGWEDEFTLSAGSCCDEGETNQSE
jgi:hypothetical protein